MSPETCRKIKAVVLIAMFAGAEAQNIQQDVSYTGRFYSMPSPSKAGDLGAKFDMPAEQSTLIAEKMEAITADPSFQLHATRIAEQIGAMMGDPNFQEQAKPVAEHMEAMGADPNVLEYRKSVAEQVDGIRANPKFQKQANRLNEMVETMKADQYLKDRGNLFAEQVGAMMAADPNLQEQLQRFAVQAEAVRADPNSPVQGRLFTEQVEAMNADPNFQEHKKQVAQKFEALKADPILQDYAKLFAEQVQATMVDPNLQQDAKRVTHQMEALLIDPSMQEQWKRGAEQMEAMQAEPYFQEQATRVADQVESMILHPNFQEQAQYFAEEVMESEDGMVNMLAARSLKAARLQDLDMSTLGKAAAVAQPQAKPVMHAAMHSHSKMASAHVLRATPSQQQPQPQASFAPSAAGYERMSALSTPAQQSSRIVVQSAGKSGKPKIVQRAEGENSLEALSDTFCNLFALWLTIAALAALQIPSTFTWIPDTAFTGLLGLLMFSVGVTTSIQDFKDCMTRPGAVAANFFACYGIMPAVAYASGLAIGAEGAILAGLVLVGSVNGGQASNLCTLIAGGDVALSVLMTTSTTLGCIVMTPLICKFLLGAVVPINAMGIVISTFQVVLAPIFLGVGVNTAVPKVAAAITPFTPVIGVIATVLLVGASVAKVAPTIISSGWPLQLACINLHLVGGILGYFTMKVTGADEKTCRTVAIETAMKSSAFGFFLASQHFGAFNARVPSAVSVVWMAITGSLMAVYWKFRPVDDKPAAAPAMELFSENPDESSGYLLPGLSALASFMFAVIGLRTYRSFEKSGWGMQEPLVYM